MPFVLVMLFIIALFLMFAGLFLSPRFKVNRIQNAAQMTAAKRRPVDAPTGEMRPIPLRAGRTKTTDSANTGALRPRWRTSDTDTEATEQHARASADINATRQRARASSEIDSTETRQRARASSETGTTETRQRARTSSGSDTTETRQRARASSETGTTETRQRARISDAGAVRARTGTQERYRRDKPRIGILSLVDSIGKWKIFIPGLIAIFLVGFYLFSQLFSQQLLWVPGTFGQPSIPTPTPAATAKPPVYTASKSLQRLYQLDPAQYQTTQQYNDWAYSACSAAAMTEVINAYGHNYRITNILTVESQIGEIGMDDGLKEESGVAHTGTKFGFKTTWGHTLSLDQVIAAANSGTPVIVSFPPDRYPGGHILVVRGGDQNDVYLADSSRNNWTQLTRARFLQLWEGFSAIMTPS